MSPRSMVMHLSIEQERKLKQIEAKHLESQTKRENDVSFFAHHIGKKNQLRKGPKT